MVSLLVWLFSLFPFCLFWLRRRCLRQMLRSSSSSFLLSLVWASSLPLVVALSSLCLGSFRRDSSFVVYSSVVGYLVCLWDFSILRRVYVHLPWFSWIRSSSGGWQCRLLPAPPGCRVSSQCGCAVIVFICVSGVLLTLFLFFVREELLVVPFPVQFLLGLCCVCLEAVGEVHQSQFFLLSFPAPLSKK